MNTPAEYFDRLFQGSDDPWAFRQRWYEKRKRDLTLASLPRQRYERAFEPGCANGELSLALAERCDELVVMDFNERAVALAKQRLGDYPNAEVLEGHLPGDWPGGMFDLVVLSEVGYYLGEPAWREVIQQMLRSLAPTGSVLACHWLHPIEGAPQRGRQVHQLLDEGLGLHKAVSHQEADFILEVWCVVPCTVDLDEKVVGG
ncbi:class I SAM-dependent methyltransferase [Pseudomonas typographi]|uniref:class I SAM-dependent methyltransferase n=1 Tax=Pseudomonas typographi TaxID=2715964 RepID=UPI00168337C2|nr:class I SAM-dependent methyltransferase [Pseudomonas typographi]MBD1587067.1 class I SAM-dependent methyltransferase [Pseudomonas typographi]